MNLKILALSALLLFAASAAAFEPFTIKDIRIEGIQRTEAGTVFSYLPVKAGDKMDEAKADASIRALFATGFFKDVSLEKDQDVLVVRVRERPAIASVEINGVKTSSFSKDQLRDNMKFVGLVQGRIFDKSVLEKAAQQLKREYTSRGKYAVEVNTVVTPLERNRVAIVFNVVEGEASQIRQINIIGTHDYSEDELRDLLKLGTPGMFSWMSGNDKYSKPKLAADIETLKSFYLDSGYLEFSVDSTRVSISPDKKDIFITINITEGPKYTISNVKVSGPEKILPHEEIRKMISVKPGDVFSRKELAESSKRIADRLGNDGYAFANVNPVPEVDKDRHQVAFTFTVDPGQRFYVRRVNISGNAKTNDEVIRREFRQLEGAWFDTGKTKKSKQRLDRLDYFSEVSIETPIVQGTSDQVDVNVTVKEKSTGNFSLGAGVSSGEGLILSASVSQHNVFGTGNFLSTQVNTSRVNRVASVSYTNPYYTDDGVSRGFDVYKRNTNTTNTNVVSQYTAATDGAGVRFGVPIADEQYIHYGLAYENTTIGLTQYSPQRFYDYIKTFGTTTINYMGTVGWSHDSRDSAVNTTEGLMQSINLESGLPATPNSLRYYKLTMQNQWFYPVSQDLTFMTNVNLGAGNGYGGKPLPFFKNFYGGGPGSVRGYEPASLGPVDVTGLATGGNRMVVVSGELLFPMPGMSKEKSVRMSAFVDAGAIYGPIVQNTLPQALGMHYSAGLALTWLSPMGPLKVSLGYPIHKQPGDKLQKFQLTLGTFF
jgi:outer membrane protein insertion porin family